MTPEEVLKAVHQMDEAEFRAHLESLSWSQRRKANKSLKKVENLMRLATILDARDPHEFLELAEGLGFKDVRKILEGIEGATVFTPHKHKCDCGTIFEHNPWNIERGPKGIDAHSCPKCHACVIAIYHGDKPATVFNHGETL